MSDSHHLDNTAPIAMQPTKDTLVLGRYRVIDEGKQGAFGTVMTCWDTKLQRRVAIKRMPLINSHTTGANTSHIEDALAEARTASMLAHPNIVQVFDFETDLSAAYLVMEYVDGMSLTELLARIEGEVLTADECAYVIASVAAALEFAHQNRVLHLDVKPSNILIDKSGGVKLCDFGMSALASATGYADARGGTIGYMSPEQILGELVDERSDVFSLATVTWQALVGVNPFAAPTAEESLKLIEKKPRYALSKMVASAKGPAEEAVVQALSTQREKRPSSVGAFGKAIATSLGSPQAGKASLHNLLSQVPSTPEDELQTDAERTAPTIDINKWGRFALRLISAALVLPFVQRGASLLFAQDQLILLTCAVAGVCTFIWPAVSSVVALGILGFALFNSATSLASAVGPLALITSVLLWWFSLGRKNPQSGLTVLPACLLGTSLATPALAAIAMDPMAAAVTSGASHLFVSLYGVLMSGDVPNTLAFEQMVVLIQSPTFYITGAFCALGAFIGSFICHRWSSLVSSIVAQIFVLLSVCTPQIVHTWVENSSDWPALDGREVAIALLLSILACFLAVLQGSRSTDEEFGSFDEST